MAETARPATLQAGGALTAVAGNDINLSPGEATQSVDEAREFTSKGLLSTPVVPRANALRGKSGPGCILNIVISYIARHRMDVASPASMA